MRRRDRPGFASMAGSGRSAPLSSSSPASDVYERPELERVISLAVQAPSVSNTQSWSVRAYRDAQDISDILKLQNGNVGNSPIPVLLVVTVDIRNFTGSNERNQMCIDGGIFLQQLLLSLHALGLYLMPI